MTLTATLAALVGLVESSQVTTGTVISRDVQEQSIIDGGFRAYWMVTIEGWTPTGKLRQRQIFVTTAQWYACKEGAKFPPLDTAK